MGLFGNIFDFNGDGQLDAFEKAAEFGMFMNMIESLEDDEQNDDEFDDDDF